MSEQRLLVVLLVVLLSGAVLSGCSDADESVDRPPASDMGTGAGDGGDAGGSGGSGGDDANDDAGGDDGGGADDGGSGAGGGGSGGDADDDPSEEVPPTVSVRLLGEATGMEPHLVEIDVTVNAGGPFTYTLSWGDGTSEAGEGSGGGFVFQSAHTFEAGRWTIRVDAEDAVGMASDSVSVEVTADPDAEGPDDPRPAATWSLDIVGSAFSPQDLTVQVGDTLVWTNQDGFLHTVTEETFEFDSDDMAQGATFDWQPDLEGTFDYFCQRHPTMTGTITVQEIYDGTP